MVKFLGDYGQKPIYMFGGFGMLMCSLGVLCGVETLVEKFVFDTMVHKNPVILLAIFLFLIGIQSILMGILADLQMRTFYESQGKRTYLVRQSVGFEDE